MPVVTDITQLSATASSNYPTGTENANTVDDYIRQQSAFIAQLQSRMVSVKDYGATGDGTTDDTAAIQAALDSGVDVFVPGTANYYKITSALTMGSNQRIYGEGERSQIRQTTANAVVISATAKAKVVVDNLLIYAVGSFTSLTDGCGVFFSGCSDCKATNLIVKNHRGLGVCLYDTNDSVVSDCLFTDSPVSGTDLHTESTGDIGVIYSSSRNLIEGNRCRSGQGIGVYIQTINDDDIADGNIVSNNIIENAKAYGIMVYRVNSVASLENTVVVGNYIRNTTGELEESTYGFIFGCAIYLQGAEYSTVVGNSIDGAHTGAITFVEQLAPGAIGVTNMVVCTITGNTIRNAGQWGVYVNDPNAAGVTDGQCVIASNIIDTAVKDGIKIQRRGDVLISGNAIARSTDEGIHVANIAAKENISIIGNALQSVGGVAAIYVEYGDTVNISGNTIDNPGTHGIAIANSNDVTINDNSVTSHGSRAITVLETCARVSVAHNHVRGVSSSEGIHLLAATRLGENYVTGCTTPYTGSFAPFYTLTVNSTSPSVADGSRFITNNSNPTTITNFSDGYDGQEIFVVFTDANTTLDFTASNLKGNGGVDRAMAANDAIRAIYKSGSFAWWVTIVALS